MSDNQRALLSFVIGVVCLLSTVGKAAGLDEAIGLFIGAANLICATWLVGSGRNLADATQNPPHTEESKGHVALRKKEG